MTDYDNFKFIMELLDIMIDNIEDMTFKTNDREELQRLVHVKECMSKAYIYGMPLIIKKGDM